MALLIGPAAVTSPNGKLMSENMFAAAEDIPQLIHQLVGAGSTCWIGGTGDSEFWTAQARKVAEQAITRLNELGCQC